MSPKPAKPFAQVVAEVGRYPEEAFHFVREGLNYTVEKIHGPTTPEQVALLELLQSRNIELSEVIEAYEAGSLSDQLAKALDDAGGPAALNRHVSGQELSWGLRDYALQRWGYMARAVLARWGVRCTMDFGRIVFAMVDNAFMQKQPGDSVDDFGDVFDFTQAFEENFEPGGTHED
jgi:uncharacterized repeat protein (TIGR04138 family)